MSEFRKVTCKAQIDLLDENEVMAGYLGGLGGSTEPGSDKSRSYWHGWRNGRVDGGFAQPDAEQRLLAAQVYRAGVLH